MTSRMEQQKAEIAAQLRRRAFRSRNARAALKLMALADDVPRMNLPNGGRFLVHMTVPDRPGDTPALRRLRKKKRWLDYARPINRHPRILEQLAEILPRARNRPGARLREDLHLDDGEIAAFAGGVENAFGIGIDRRDAGEWETLNDVTDTIAAAIATEPA